MGEMTDMAGNNYRNIDTVTVGSGHGADMEREGKMKSCLFYNNSPDKSQIERIHTETTSSDISQSRE